ncbi:protein lethal(2)essential for life-like [Plodia interpunctella]|uniref:protein lethal(2)essential for life-like n=1 Tax=Plodia interpunctella TaxID=58824 RepID=UPI0023676810|nr:protein lethal(2)essential for life-like [Plodia interpunctella]
MFRYPFYLEAERARPRSQLLDQHFGLGLTPNDYLTIVAIPQSGPDYFRNWRDLKAAANDAGSTIKLEKDKFQVNLDVQHFAPEEISVKTIDGYLVIDAKHEERQDEHGYISRSFSRKYPLPDGIDPDTVVSKLSSDGVLTITAPLKAPPKAENERIVPIVQTGPVRKQVEHVGQEEQG